MHTPGPWYWYKGYDSICRVKIKLGKLDTGVQVDFGFEDGLYSETGENVVHGLWRNDNYADCRASSEDNARLIAAAPKLLEVCKAVFECWNEDGLDDEVPLYKQVRLAIAKAEGKQ